MKKLRDAIASLRRGSEELYVPTEASRHESKLEEKSTTVEEMNTDYVKKNHDFTMIKEADLRDAFILLRRRCSDSWNFKYEERACELHKMFMILCHSKTAELIDPAPKFTDSINQDIETKDGDELIARQLMTDPKLWKMWDRNNAKQFFEILYHLTRFAPFKGRPFVRAWLEALIPCLCRWVLLSVERDAISEKGAAGDGNNSSNELVVLTLKHFLGAFGQPGIVACLVDSGIPMLRTLQSCARSVEAIGRGEAERYYWKRITESKCGGTNNWGELAKVEDIPLKLSQLDHLPAGWLEDANDFAHFFSEVLSQEITPIFEKRVKDLVGGQPNISVHAGPPKTLSRSLAKGAEYMAEFKNLTKSERWTRFGKKFEEAFGRQPNSDVDFVWNVVDFARCSVIVPNANDVLDIKKLVEDHFEVVSVKNGYNSNVQVKGSGYRDMKLLVKVDFEGLELKHIPNLQQKTVLICEIQIISKAWLVNKKTTSLSYKILRATSLKQLCKDFGKYVTADQDKIEHRAIDVIKHGWTNLAKAVDFSDIDGKKVFIDAASEGWEEGTVSILVNHTQVNPDVRDHCGRTPLILAARNGNFSIIKGLLNVRCEINSLSKYNCTALHWASRNGHESCVRALMATGCDTTVRDFGWNTALDRVNAQIKTSDNPVYQRIARLLRGENVPQLSSIFDKDTVGLHCVTQAAVSGWLTDFLDSRTVSIEVISKLLASTAAVTSLENVLQLLWFGADVETKSSDDWTAILYAANYGTLETVSILLDHGAKMEVLTYSGFSPLHLACVFNTADVVNKFIESGADVYQKSNKLSSAFTLAKKNKEHGSAIAEVFKSHGFYRQRSD